MSGPLTSSSSEVPFLKRLQNELKTLSADQVTFIEGYFPKTKIESGFFFTLADIGKALEFERNPLLSKKFAQIKDEYRIHIGDRIAVITQRSFTKPSNPWADQFNQANEEHFLRAALHVQDILFACEQIANHELTEGKENLLNELETFANVSLEEYLRLLPALTNDQKTLIRATFQALKTAFANSNFELANQSLASIRKELTSSRSE